MFTFEVLGYEVGVVVLEGNFGLGGLVEGVSAEADLALRRRHPPHPCNAQTQLNIREKTDEVFSSTTHHATRERKRERV